MVRKSEISIKVQCPLQNEAEIFAAAVDFLSAKKTEGKIDGAQLSTKEIEVATQVEI